ncbi:MAG: hypothetical protein ACD_28C00011G0013 [uncultured bacterium]|nr:MAG: hypothetical protein ACD_28C00011G0013 [uncultured bacterium]KKT74257.1 MAG: hypothetical protein UW70_C0061G0012 [Candidatus Peregrinibacteria bacterium GW2011_GWA2_44_7]
MSDLNYAEALDQLKKRKAQMDERVNGVKADVKIFIRGARFYAEKKERVRELAGWNEGNIFDKTVKGGV